MRTFFNFIAIIGISYTALITIISYNPLRFKNRFRKQVIKEQLSKTFQSEVMQKSLYDAGINIASSKVNLFRTFASIGFLVVTYASMYFQEEQLHYWPLVVCLIFILCTSPAPFTPSGWVLKKLYERNIIRKDGELIAFIKLYENNRMKSSGFVQFEAFCAQIAPHFEHIGKDLLLLSERVVEDGLEAALDWFCSLFPRDHAFIHDFRSIILTVENMDDYETVAKHLKAQSSIIARISSDQYQRRWNFIADIATIFTTIPSILIFIMVIALVLLYVGIVKDNFTNVNLIS